MRSLSTPYSRRMLRRFALALVGDGDQQVLDADELVLEALGLGVGGLEHAHDARRRVDLHDVVAELRRLAEVVRRRCRAAASTWHAELLEDAARRSRPGGVSMARKTCSTSHWEWRCWRTISWRACSTSCACSVNLSCLIMFVYLPFPYLRTARALDTPRLA